MTLKQQRVGSIGQLRGPEQTDALLPEDSLRLELVIEGTARYQLGESQPRLSRCTLVWHPPGEARSVREASADYRAWGVSFAAPVLKRLSAASFQELLASGSGVARGIARPRARRLLSLFRALCEDDVDTERFNAGLVFLLLSAWAEHERGGDPAELHPAVAKATKILKMQPTGRASLEELAATCGASPSWLSRLFRREMNVSLVDYRNQRRIERFFELYDGRHISKAAFRAGFGSYAQFHRVFRRALGQSPAELLKRQGHGTAAHPVSVVSMLGTTPTPEPETGAEPQSDPDSFAPDAVTATPARRAIGAGGAGG